MAHGVYCNMTMGHPKKYTMKEEHVEVQKANLMVGIFEGASYESSYESLLDDYDLQSYSQQNSTSCFNAARCARIQ